MISQFSDWWRDCVLCGRQTTSIRSSRSRPWTNDHSAGTALLNKLQVLS